MFLLIFPNKILSASFFFKLLFKLTIFLLLFYSSSLHPNFLFFSLLLISQSFGQSIFSSCAVVCFNLHFSFFLNFFTVPLLCVSFYQYLFWFLPISSYLVTYHVFCFFVQHFFFFLLLFHLYSLLIFTLHISVMKSNLKIGHYILIQLWKNPLFSSLTSAAPYTRRHHSTQELQRK